MRAKTNELQRFVIRLAIDQHQVGFKVTVAKIFPFAGKRVVAGALGKTCIFYEQFDDLQERFIESGVMFTALFAPVVPLELRSALNPPH